MRTSGADAVSGPVTCTADQSPNHRDRRPHFNGSCTNERRPDDAAAPLTVKLDKSGPAPPWRSPPARPATTAGTSATSPSSTTGSDAISDPTACAATTDLSGDTTGTAGQRLLHERRRSYRRCRPDDHQAGQDRAGGRGHQPRPVLLSGFGADTGLHHARTRRRVSPSERHPACRCWPASASTPSPAAERRPRRKHRLDERDAAVHLPMGRVPAADQRHRAPDRDTATSIFKAGSTVPVKFQLKRADGTVISPSARPSVAHPSQGLGHDSVPSTSRSTPTRRRRRHLSSRWAAVDLQLEHARALRRASTTGSA